MMTPKTALLLLAALALVAPLARAELLSGEAAAQALAAAAAAAAASAASRPSSSSSSPATGGGGGVSTSGDAKIASLMRTLRLDPDARYAPDVDRIVYTCTGLRGGGDHGHAHFNVSSTPLLALAPAGGANGLVWPNEADPSTANAFKLHSRPGAPKKIVLDFTGHRLRAGTIWANTIAEGDVPLTLPPYDVDGDPSSFSQTELANIVSTWRMVAEYFAPWNVDVTTEEPKGTDDEGDASLVGVGVRVIITGDNAWDKNPAGGSAYLSTFGEFIAGPVLMAHNIGTPKQLAVTIAHEVGHTVGLNHHGSFAEPESSVFRAYYKGHGSWAPVMGYGLQLPVVQWSRGDYAQATQPAQNDIATISTFFDYAEPKKNDKASSAEAIPPPTATTPTVTVKGVIDGIDPYYKLKIAKAGQIKLALDVAPSLANSPIRTHNALKLRVWSAATGADVGAVLDNVSEGTILVSVVATFDLPMAGTYYVHVFPSRAGDASTGFTEYGNQGTFALSLLSTTPQGIVVAANDPYAPPPLQCFGLTTPLLTRASGNCDKGWDVRPEEVFSLPSSPSSTGITLSPPAGTIVPPGGSRLFTATAPSGASCSTLISVTPCPPADRLSINCFPKTYALTPASSCSSTKVSKPQDLYRVFSGELAAPEGATVDASPPLETEVFAPGIFGVTFTSRQDPTASCLSIITVKPCTPVAVSGTVRLNSLPGTCAAALPSPQQVVTPASLGLGAASVELRAKPNGPVVPEPISTGNYFASVVYFEGYIVSNASASPVRIEVVDSEAPRAEVKNDTPRLADNFICARGATARATTACVPLDGISGILSVTDNCGAAGVTRKWACTGAGCAKPSATAKTLCVPVRARRGRVEAKYTLTVTDKKGNKSTLVIPIAAYHFSDAAPSGAKCVSA